MSNSKISALTSATTPLVGTEVLPIVQSGTTVQVANNALRPKQIQSNATSGVLQVAGPAAASTRVMTIPDANFTVARTDATQSFTGDQTLSTGNLIQGTSAKGINFTANTPASGMTSQLLNWYEEGTWTPTLVTDGTNFTSVSYTASTGAKYIRMGKIVYVQGYLRTSSVTVGSASGNVSIGGLPFTSSSNTGSMNNGLGDGIISQAYSWTTNNPCTLTVAVNSTLMNIIYRSTANGETNGIPISSVGTGANANAMVFNAMYICA